MTPKSGKSTFFHKAFGSDAIFAATEKGYLGLAGVMAVDIPKWVDFQQFIHQLKRPEVKARFKVVVIDTVDLLYEAATKHVLMIQGVAKLGDIAYGAGYQMVDELFKDALLEIQGLGYGIAFISHTATETIKDTEQVKYKPSVNKRGAAIINKMVDTIAFAYLSKNEQGQEVRSLYLRETMHFVAGTRFAFMPPVIELDADVFKAEMSKAIEKEGEVNPDALTSEKQTKIMFEQEFDFTQLMQEIGSIAMLFSENSKMNEYMKIVENHLGKGKMVSELVPGQEDIMSIILDELKELKDELNLG